MKREAWCVALALLAVGGCGKDSGPSAAERREADGKAIAQSLREQNAAFKRRQWLADQRYAAHLEQVKKNMREEAEKQAKSDADARETREMESQAKLNRAEADRVKAEIELLRKRNAGR